MRSIHAVAAALVASAALATVVAEAAPRPPSPPVATATVAPRVAARDLPGWRLYDQRCLPCHGAAGDGHGPAAPWLWPRPRDLTAAAYKWRSTDLGDDATDADLADTIRWGAPGTAMPGFGATLDDDDVAALVAVVRAFAAEPAPAAAGYGVAPATPGDVDRGAAVWARAGCVSCHGERGHGDGPAAAKLTVAGVAAPPYDLAGGVRRPRPDDDPASVQEAIEQSVARGLAGTAMPGYGDALSAAELRDVATFVASLRGDAAAPRGPGPIPDGAIAADRDGKLARAGWWPGVPDAAGAGEREVFGETIRLQGEPPDALAPATASLSSRRCARCHAKQVREWTGSIHSQAASPGLIGQVLRLSGARAESCQRCHAPLAEQQPELRPGQEAAGAPSPEVDASTDYRASPWYDADLRAEGLTCAACHVRAWTRHGPTTIAASLAPVEGYPTAPLAIYERADFCLPCHQLEPRAAVEGRPLLDTYREWLAGPYMRRGVQCQHCHMPNREHTFKGVHDPDTFRQGIDVEAIAARGATGVVSVRARVRNVGAGHLLPTTPTPAAWLRVELFDAAGRPIKGARAERRIGRQIRQVDGAWQDVEDTRIPPGDALEVAAGWRDGRVAEATVVRVTVEVHPDDYYEGLYRSRLRGALPAAARAQFERALERATASHYVAYEADVAIAAP